jgi:hypothetical protein
MYVEFFPLLITSVKGCTEDMSEAALDCGKLGHKGHGMIIRGGGKWRQGCEYFGQLQLAYISFGIEKGCVRMRVMYPVGVSFGSCLLNSSYTRCCMTIFSSWSTTSSASLYPQLDISFFSQNVTHLSRPSLSWASWCRICCGSLLDSQHLPAHRVSWRKPTTLRHLDSRIIELTRSNAPLTRWYLTPGQSCDLPPLTSTTLCCWML